MSLIEWTGWLDRFNTAALDSILLVGKSARVDSIVIVEITEEDYRNPALFDGKSPLDRRKLHAVIDAIRQGGPHLIVVDVDTSEAWDNDAWVRGPDDRPIDKCSPPIVWAQEPLIQSRTEPVKPVPFEDARHTEPPCGSGLAIVPTDPDEVVRRYLRRVPATTTRGVENLNSLPWAAFNMQSRFKVDSRPYDDTLILNFAGDRYSFGKYPASAILEGAGTGDVWRTSGPLTDRIVLLGGTFNASRDVHRTARGEISGVELTAQILAAELLGGGIRTVDRVVELSVEFSVGLLLIVVGYLGLTRTVAFANIALIPAFALFGSYVVFSTFSHWFSFIPHWMSVAVQQWLERRQHLWLRGKENRAALTGMEAGRTSETGPARTDRAAADPRQRKKRRRGRARH